MAKTFLQVRTDERDKEQASVILEQLGTNLLCSEYAVETDYYDKEYSV